MNRIRYCAICGYAPLFLEANICPHCKNWLLDVTLSKFDSEYYANKSIEKYGDRTHWREFLIEEAEQNPEYNPDTTEHNAADALEQQIDEIFKPKTSANIPTCPTCGSTKLKKISDIKRAGHWLAFGFLSQTARSQFECENCGYKW